MKTFTDNAGRPWTIAINVDAIKRVRGLLGVDLMDAVEGKLIQNLLENPILLCDVVYCLVKAQADSAGVSDEDFGRSMGGDAIDLATAAMLEELVGFFPPRRRALLTKALEKFRLLEQTAIQKAGQRLDDPALMKRMDEALDKALRELEPSEHGGSSTSLPG